jgi:ADP-ribose pyrophosphatase YjhB (NUDIX family)
MGERLDDPGAASPVSGFVDGAPGWMADALRFCSRCGGGLEFGAVEGEDRPRHQCASCGFIAYVNPRLVVTTLPVNERREVVLLRRGIPPGYGAWAQPGGFLESDETTIMGAVRETREETGLLVEPTRIVGIYTRPQAGVAVVAYEARITGGEMTTTPEALQVKAYRVDDIPWPLIAFNTTLWALRDWVRGERPGIDADRLGSEHEDG